MKFFLRYPSIPIRQKHLPIADFSYPEVGATQDRLPDSLQQKYNIDRYYKEIGRGTACFQQAKKALQQWSHFDLGWIHIEAPPPAVGLVVPIAVRVFGIWTLNYCKVVYIIDEQDKWGFAYGTLSTHGEMGEERFLIYHNSEDVVSYEIVAFSKPQSWLAKVGYPFTRILQRRFGRESIEKIHGLCKPHPQ